MTIIRRYRKTCLNAYPLRRERSQNFDNNNHFPNYWNLQLPPIIFAETWPYPIADPINIANTTGNWTQTGSTLHTLPLCQMGNPVGQVNWGEGGFITFPNLWTGIRNVPAQRANKGLQWAMQIEIKSLAPGLVGDGGNKQTWTLGTQNGVEFQNDATNGVQIFHYGNAGILATYNRGFNASYNKTITVIVNGAVSDLYEGSTKLGTVAIVPEVAGFVGLQCDSSMSNGNSVGIGLVLGRVALYGTHP
jgi:hypothetical protein